MAHFFGNQPPRGGSLAGGGNVGRVSADDIITLDQHLCRYPLLGQNEADCAGGIDTPLVYLPVHGVQSYWEKQPLSAQLDLFRHLVASVSQENARIAFVIHGTSESIRLYYGCLDGDLPRIQSCLKGFFPGILLGNPVYDGPFGKPHPWKGVMVGQPGQIPTDTPQTGNLHLPVDVLCSSMLGSEFLVMALAERFPTSLVLDMLTSVRMEDQRVSSYQTKAYSDNSHVVQENRVVQDYMRHLQMAAADLERGIQEGMWSASIYFSSADRSDCIRLESILKSAWMGQRDQVYQPLHCIGLNCCSSCAAQCGEGSCIHRACLSTNLVPYARIGVLDNTGDDNPEDFNDYHFCTALTSSQLSLFCQMPRHEFPGYAVNPYVEFDTAARVRIPPEKAMRLGNVVRVDQLMEKHPIPNPYLLDIDDLTRHLLVVGITGGGKSNTSKAILSEIWSRYRLPFLVIESAKREYHELMNVTAKDAAGRPQKIFPAISLFTLGDENQTTGIPYRLNPFEVIPGCSIQTHIESLLATFKAAFELFPPMPYVLETMVYEVYQDRGWDTVTNTNRYGLTTWPTLSDLYYKIDEVTDRLGYHEEVSNNVKAALRARINSLRTGGKGAMMDVPRSIPLHTLLKNPTVLELEDLGDDDSKAFVIGVLMVQLYEYRKSQASSKHVKHLLVIEEAHRLLKKVPAGSGDQSKAKSVEFFCNMLSEIRSYGQAIMICDQVPTRLADDALKNTNCKIVHRTVMEEDRHAVGRAMHMTDDQVDFLSSLPRGCAAVYAEGDSRPRLVRFPLVEQAGTLSRHQLLDVCRANMAVQYADALQIHHHCHACRFCEAPGCPWLGRCNGWFDTLGQDTLVKYWKTVTIGNSRIDADKLIYLRDTIQKTLSITLDRNQELCLIGGLLQRFNLPELRQAQLITEFLKARNKQK